MKKTTLTTTLAVLLCAGNLLLAQDIPWAGIHFTVDNGKGRTQMLTLGVKEGATTGIDLGLSESELPPLPPNEIFDARLLSTPGKSQLGTGSLNDFRPITNKTAPFILVYTIGFQGGEGVSSVKLTWDLPYHGRITKVAVDGQDVAAQTELNSQFGQGQFTVELTFNFQPLTFTANPASLDFVAGDRDPLPMKTIEITPHGDTQASWHITPGESWLSVSPSNNNGRQTVEVSINTNQIPNGTYTTNLVVRSPLEPGSLTIPVTLNFTVGLDDVAAPNGMLLRQNYPNPFTSSTSFDVDLGARPSLSAPVLLVYDAKGREVANLSSRLARTAGRQTVTFDAGTFPPGVYTYTLTHGGHELTRTMLLVR